MHLVWGLRGPCLTLLAFGRPFKCQYFTMSPIFMLRMNIRKNIFLALTSGLLLGLPWSASSLFFVVFIAWGPLLLLEEEVRHHANPYAIFNYAFVNFLLWNIIGTWWIMQAQLVGAILRNQGRILDYNFLFWVVFQIASPNSLTEKELF